MTDPEKAEYECTIRLLVTKLEETVGENDRLREENARLRSSAIDAGTAAFGFGL